MSNSHCHRHTVYLWDLAQMQLVVETRKWSRYCLPEFSLMLHSLGWVAFSLAPTSLAVVVLVWQHKKLWLFLNIPHLWPITALISFVCAWVFMWHTYFLFLFLFSVSFCSQPTKGQIPVRGRTDNNLQAQIRTKQLIGQRKKKELWHLASTSHFPLFVDAAVILVSATLAYF